MKKYINIILASAIGALTVLSCAQKETPYEPGAADPSDCYGVFFPSQDAMGSHTYDPSMDKTVSITVSRTNTNGAITVPFSTTVSDEGVFNFGTIAFADGQSETELDVTFPGAPEGKTLSFSVQLDDDNAYISHYGSGAIAMDFSVLIVTWQYFLNPKTGEKAVVAFNEGWWGETAWAYVKYYEVNGIRTCKTETFLHEYNGEQYDGPGLWGTGEDYEWTFIWYTKNQNQDGHDLIRIPEQNTGYHHSSYDADVYALDYFYWNATDPNDEAEFLKYASSNGDVVSYYDGNGGFYLSIRSYYMFGVGGWNPGAYDTIGIAEGFTRVDYSLKLETDYGSDGVTPVYVTAGADVASLKYAVYEGELNSAQLAAKLEAITAGSEATETYDEFEFDEEDAKNYGAFGIAPETSGAYTVIAVACSADGAIQNNASIVVNHISAADTEENLVALSVFTEETPARYQELHGYDSFAYGVSGTDLTEVHIGIIAEGDITSGETAMAAVKGDASLAVSEEVLAEINADGGYYTIATGLKAKTTYYVIVWATNGALDGFAVDSFTTDSLPYVWNSLGKGTITDGLFVSLFSRPDYTMECDVFEEASTPGLYMITGFQCSLTAQFFGVSEEEMAEYENGNWYNAEVVIDATDPNAVYIGEQEYGVLVNSNYGWILIDSEPSGTLSNGEITFPAKEMYVYLGGWYYGNSNGTFKVTLPASASTSAVIVPSRGGYVSNATIVTGKQLDRSVKYERDPKPVKVSVEIPVARKEKEHNQARKIEKIQSAPVLR